MLRTAGIFLSFMVMAQNADAALINFGKWTFGTAGASTLAGSGSGYTTAQNFNNGVGGFGGNSGASFFNPGNPGLSFSTGQGTKSFSATIVNTFVLPIIVTQVQFDGRRSNNSGFVTTVDISDKTGLAFKTTNSLWSSASSNNYVSGVDFKPVLLLTGQAMTVKFNTVVPTAQSVYLDNVTINGVITPEPASIAVFGLLGGGFVISAYRRRRI
jgi:hypothetical protein